MQKRILSFITIVCIIGNVSKNVLYASEPLSKADCLPNTNPIKDTTEETEKYELACLKKGFKNIWWSGKTTSEPIREKEWSASTYGILKFYMFSPFEGIKKFDSLSIIIYRKSHERNALLLEKYLLENDISIYSDFVRIMTFFYTIAATKRC